MGKKKLDGVKNNRKKLFKEKTEKTDKTEKTEKIKKKAKIQLFSIRNKIFVCFLVPVMFVIIVGTVSYQKAAEGMSEEFEESTIQTIGMAMDYIEMSNSFIKTEAMKYAFGDINKYYLGSISDKIEKMNVMESTKTSLTSAQGANSLISNIHIVT